MIRPRSTAARSLVLAVLLVLTATSCSSTDAEAEADRRPATAASDDPAVGDAATSSDEETASVEDDGGPRTPFPEPGASTDDVTPSGADVSEAPAQPPVIDDDVDPDTERASDTNAPQAAVGVTESALCATLQIGRDAVADRADELADDQRDLLIERRSDVADDELATILDDLDADTPLDATVAEAGLRRCQALGYEI